MSVYVIFIPGAILYSFPMDDTDFEGTLVLEKLAEIDQVDAFFEAIDSDDFQGAAGLMKRAGVDAATIAIVLKKMRDADGEH
ncbi:MAG TPA: hypothetical protein VM598_08280 [Bdellovibrionota bacterium]|nr:hypothetical protein [Bdellovibrionota bacterium]